MPRYNEERLKREIEEYASGRKDIRLNEKNPVEAYDNPHFKDIKKNIVVREKKTLISVQSSDRDKVNVPVFNRRTKESYEVRRLTGEKGSSIVKLYLYEEHGKGTSFLSIIESFPRDPVRSSFYGVEYKDIIFSAVLGRPIFITSVTGEDELTIELPIELKDNVDFTNEDSSKVAEIRVVENVRDAYPYPNNYRVSLPKEFRQVKAVTLVSAEIPNTQPLIHHNTRIQSDIKTKEDAQKFKYNPNNKFIWEIETDQYVDSNGESQYYTYEIDVEEGSYDANELMERITNQTNLVQRRRYVASNGQWAYRNTPDVFRADDDLLNRFEYSLNENQTKLYLTSIMSSEYSTAGSITTLKNQSRIHINVTDVYGTRNYPQTRVGDTRIFEDLDGIEGITSENLNTEHRISASPLYALYVILSYRDRTKISKPLEVKIRSTSTIGTYQARVDIRDVCPCLVDEGSTTSIFQTDFGISSEQELELSGIKASSTDPLVKIDPRETVFTDPTKMSWSPFLLSSHIVTNSEKFNEWTPSSLKEGYHELIGYLPGKRGEIIYHGRILTVYSLTEPLFYPSTGVSEEENYWPSHVLLLSNPLPMRFKEMKFDIRDYLDPGLGDFSGTVIRTMEGMDSVIRTMQTPIRIKGESNLIEDTHQIIKGTSQASRVGYQVLRASASEIELYMGPIESITNSFLEKNKLASFFASSIENTESIYDTKYEGDSALILSGHPLLSYTLSDSDWTVGYTYEYDHILKKTQGGQRGLVYGESKSELDRIESEYRSESDEVNCSGSLGLGLAQLCKWNETWINVIELISIDYEATGGVEPLDSSHDGRLWLTYYGSQSSLEQGINTVIRFGLIEYDEETGAKTTHHGSELVDIENCLSVGGTETIRIGAYTFQLKEGEWLELGYGMTWEFRLVTSSGSERKVIQVDERDLKLMGCDRVWSEGDVEMFMTGSGSGEIKDQIGRHMTISTTSITEEIKGEIYLGKKNKVYSERYGEDLPPQVSATEAYSAGEANMIEETNLQVPSELYGEWIVGETSRAHGQVVFGFQQIDIEDETLSQELGINFDNMETPNEPGVRYSYGRLVVALEGVDNEKFQNRSSVLGATSYFEMYRNYTINERLNISSWTAAGIERKAYLIAPPLQIYAMDLSARFGQMQLIDPETDTYRLSSSPYQNETSLSDNIPGRKTLWDTLAELVGITQSSYVAEASRIGNIRDKNREYLEDILTTALNQIEGENGTIISGILQEIAETTFAIHPEFHQYLRIRKPDIFGYTGSGTKRGKSTNGLTKPYYIYQEGNDSMGVVVPMHLPSHKLKAIDFSKKQVKVTSETWRNKTEYGWSDGRGVFSLSFFRDTGDSNILPLPQHTIFYHKLSQWNEFPLIHPYQNPSRYHLDISPTDTDPTPDTIFTYQEQDNEETIIPELTRALYPNYLELTQNGRIESNEFTINHLFKTDTPVTLISNDIYPLWTGGIQTHSQWTSIDVSNTDFQSHQLDVLNHIQTITQPSLTDVNKQSIKIDQLTDITNPWEYWASRLDEENLDEGNVWIHSMNVARFYEDMEGIRYLNNSEEDPQPVYPDDILWKVNLDISPEGEDEEDEEKVRIWPCVSINPWKMNRPTPIYAEDVSENAEQTRPFTETSTSRSTETQYDRRIVGIQLDQSVLKQQSVGMTFHTEPIVEPIRNLSVEPIPCIDASEGYQYVSYHDGVPPVQNTIECNHLLYGTEETQSSTFPNVTEADILKLGPRRVAVSFAQEANAAGKVPETERKDWCQRMDQSYFYIDVHKQSEVITSYPENGEITSENFIERFIFYPLVQWDLFARDLEKSHLSERYQHVMVDIVSTSQIEISVNFEVSEGDLIQIGPCVRMVSAVTEATTIMDKRTITVEPEMPVILPINEKVRMIIHKNMYHLTVDHESTEFQIEDNGSGYGWDLIVEDGGELDEMALTRMSPVYVRRSTVTNGYEYLSTRLIDIYRDEDGKLIISMADAPTAYYLPSDHTEMGTDEIMDIWIGELNARTKVCVQGEVSKVHHVYIPIEITDEWEVNATNHAFDVSRKNRIHDEIEDETMKELCTISEQLITGVIKGISEYRKEGENYFTASSQEQCKQYVIPRKYVSEATWDETERELKLTLYKTSETWMREMLDYRRRPLLIGNNEAIGELERVIEGVQSPGTVDIYFKTGEKSHIYYQERGTNLLSGGTNVRYQVVIWSERSVSGVIGQMIPIRTEDLREMCLPLQTRMRMVSTKMNEEISRLNISKTYKGRTTQGGYESVETKYPYQLPTHTVTYQGYDQNSYQIIIERKNVENPLYEGDRTTEQNLKPTETKTFGGSAFTILRPLKFRLRFDKTNTVGKILGFPNVGTENGMTEFQTIHRNESEVYRGYIKNIYLSKVQPAINFLLFQADKRRPLDRIIIEVSIQGSMYGSSDTEKLGVGQSFRLSDIQIENTFGYISRSVLEEMIHTISSIEVNQREETIKITTEVEGLDPLSQNTRRGTDTSMDETETEGAEKIASGGLIRFMKTEKPIQMTGPTSLYVVSKALGNMMVTNGMQNVFCKLLLTEAPGNILFDTQITNGKVFFETPMPRLNEIDIFFLDADHQPYDFNNVDHTLTFEILEQINTLPDGMVNRSSYTGLVDTVKESERRVF